jgi:molybdenum cofactor cytidylyltransferase
MKSAGKISALILAAGGSYRMGSLKPLLQVGRSSALDQAVRRFREASVHDVRVVVGHGADTVIPVVDRLKAKWVFNESYREGMLSSVLAGIRSLEPDIEAFFLLPVDTPLIKPRTIRECLEAYRESDARVIYPSFRGLRGHPPIIATSCVSGLSGGYEGGLRAFLELYEAEAMDVSVVDEGVVIGCNTPEEYGKVLAYGSREDVPTDRECEALWERFQVPGKVIAHSRMVAELARLLAVHLNCAGFDLDTDLIVAAGLLHDLAKGRPDHAREGAEILEELGYKRVARIVASHMDIRFNGRALDESDLIYLADKSVDDDRLVRLEERLDMSIQKLADNPAGLKAAVKRLKTAQAMERVFEGFLGISLQDIVRRHERSIEMASCGRRAIFLLRHGTVESGRNGKRYIGQLDLPLSEEGIRQAEMLRERLRHTPLAAVFCSDLSRSLRMAEIIAEPHGITPLPRQDLREIAMGAWEGLTFEEVRRQSPEAYHERGRDIVHYHPPGAEGFLECACRAIPALFDILRSTRGDILIVGHAGVNRILLSQAMGRSMDDLLDIDQDYGCLNLIRYCDSAFELEVLNETV